MCKFVLILFLCIGAVLSNPLQSRIVNGNNALHGQFPWMVSIRSVQWWTHLCGGALVTPEHVVTAAHCIIFSFSELFVVTGHINNLEGGRSTPVSGIRVYPEYLTTFEIGFDIGILKLATPIPFNAFELPVPIATKDPGVYPCVLSGWGLTHYPSESLPAKLQTIILWSMSHETCRETWDEVTVSEHVLCAGGVSGEGGCYGDAGSPLICNGELAGVVSTMANCGDGRPDLFTKVFQFRDWILDNIEDDILSTEEALAEVDHPLDRCKNLVQYLV